MGGGHVQFALKRQERRALECAARATADKRHWIRLRALVLLAERPNVSEVAQVLGTTRQSVYNWRARYRERRCPEDLRDRPRSGRPPELDEAARARLDALLESKPEAHGYRAHGWTVPLLLGHLQRAWGTRVADSTLRRVLRTLGWRWKRPRYVLARRDPEREGKKGGHSRAPGGLAAGYDRALPGRDDPA